MLDDKKELMVLLDEVKNYSIKVVQTLENGRDRLLDQAQGTSLRGPRGGDRWTYPAPPGLILEAPGPSGLSLGQGDQSVPSAFFRAYSGSGLSTQRLARRQLLPKRRMAPRIVS